MSKLIQTLLFFIVGIAIFGPGVFWNVALGCLCLQVESNSAPAVVSASDEEVDFGREVRVILSDKCFLCHGPDQDNRKADMRLDLRDSAIQSQAFNPGEANTSEMIARILSDDPELKMPPPATGKSLSEDEIGILQRWIDQGAKYSKHWAFVPPVRPEVPSLTSAESKSWARNPIDHFILQKLQQKRWTPSPVADPVTLVRRLYLDLLGLPPSPQQIDSALRKNSFAADSKSNAQALDALAQTLLASPHFGEKWAKDWLDAARYSDSDGYEKDKQRSVWFYRDWVINAINRDLPYDQFVIQQVAGDLLPSAGQAERVATGFLRNSMVNEEGGADPEQFRVEGMFDRVDAIGKAILGITTQCAQCHTHKYDPISHDEYYSMFAALSDIEEASIPVFTPQQAQQRDRALANVQQVIEGFQTENPQWAEALTQWQTATARRWIDWQVRVPTVLPFEGEKFRVLDDGSIISESYAPTRTTNTFSLNTYVGTITAVRLDALQHPQLPLGGPGRSIYGTAALTEFSVKVIPESDPSKVQTIKFVRAYSSANPTSVRLPAAFRDRDPEKDQRVTGPIEYAFDGDGQTAWSTDIGPGRRNQDHFAVFIPEQPVQVDGDARIEFALNQAHGGWNSDDNQNYLLGRYRFSTTDCDVNQMVSSSDSEFTFSFLPLHIRNLVKSAENVLTPPQQRSLLMDRLQFEPAFVTYKEQLDQAWAEYPETDSQLVVKARPHTRQTFLMTRGDFLSPGRQVQPNVPAFLGEWEDSSEPARLKFAKWLVRKDAPTTARVIVNRVWQSYFGQGLMISPEDFGLQSQQPSHPELLDWLAVELIEKDWSLKHIHRLIVSSATYRQASVVPPSLQEHDPQNIWLGRGPRFRANAEAVRDIALTSSGLLNPALGGPSVYPPAPDFLFAPPASYGPKIWNTSNDGQQFRRSIYVHSYRSVPYPALQVFDAPKGDAACVRRERSNTPLQALVMLNEPQFLACAKAMAERVMQEGGSSQEQRLRYAYRLAVSREPLGNELKILMELLDTQQRRLENGEVHADEILGQLAQPIQSQEDTGQDTGQGQLGGRTANNQLAAMMVVTRVLLNLDETITKQ